MKRQSNLILDLLLQREKTVPTVETYAQYAESHAHAVRTLKDLPPLDPAQERYLSLASVCRKVAYAIQNKLQGTEGLEALLIHSLDYGYVKCMAGELGFNTSKYLHSLAIDLTGKSEDDADRLLAYLEGSYQSYTVELAELVIS